MQVLMLCRLRFFGLRRPNNTLFIQHKAKRATQKSNGLPSCVLWVCVSFLLLELRYHLQCSYGALVPLVAQPAAAALLCLKQVVGGYETEYYRGIVLYIEP